MAAHEEIQAVPRQRGLATAILLTLLSVGLFRPAISQAQVYSGSITGVVTDATGAVIPGAKASVTDEQKGFKYAAVTDAEGRYVLRNLPPGNYQLEATAAGMRPRTQSGIALTAGQNAQVDVRLDVAGATTTPIPSAPPSC